MELMDAIMQRRTIRGYTDQAVEPEKINTILEAGRWGASGGNSQPWDFIVVTEKELCKKVAELVKLGYRRWMTEAVNTPAAEAAILGAQASTDGFTGENVVYIIGALNFREDPDPAKRTKRKYSHPMNYQSCGIALENIMLAATDLGLGTHWLGGAATVGDELKELLGIPEEIEILTVLTLGYPTPDVELTEAQKRPRVRKPMEEIAHFNKW